MAYSKTFGVTVKPRRPRIEAIDVTSREKATLPEPTGKPVVLKLFGPTVVSERCVALQSPSIPTLVNLRQIG